MSLAPLPTQIEGALFLAQRGTALLADAPRVGKTGAALLAADMILAQRILIVTTASGRGVWLAALKVWTKIERSVAIVAPKNADVEADVLIVGWPSVADPKVRAALMRRHFDLAILDEDHYAKTLDAKRTQAVYGPRDESVIRNAAVVWPLSGTPFPHSPNDGYPRLAALAPERLEADPERGWPDVTDADDFKHRYCQIRRKKLSSFNWIDVVVGGKNEDELAARMAGFYLRRTQEDVGIRPPVYEDLPLVIDEKTRKQVDGDLDASRIIEAAEKGQTRELEMHLGPLRRLTGEIKARMAADAVVEEFECGLDRIVLMYWHRGVGDILAEKLAKFGVVRLDGATAPAERDRAVAAFQAGEARVFLGQIVAAGEAIDLSASAVLWFIETSFTPKDQAQAALRITNHTQRRQAVVKVVTLAGTIDEAMQSRLRMLWTTIRKVMA